MTSTKAEEITNPRRILAVALTDSSDHLGAVIRDLTGTAPTPQQQPPSQEEDASEHTTEPSLAGTTHPLPLSTPYYTAQIPIWLDLISSPADWSASFLSEEAKEVLGVLGGVVCVFEVPSSKSEKAVYESQNEKTRELIEGVGKVVREGLGGWEWEGVALAVGVTTTVGGKVGGGDEMDADDDMEEEINEWDDLCAEWGLEFVHHRRVVPDTALKGKGKKEAVDNNDKRNEYGEKMGIARALEALQSNDWSGGDGTGSTEGDNNNRGPFDESEDEDADYIDENNWDTEDEFDLGFGYTKKQKMEMRKAFWKGTEESNRTTEEELKAFRSVTQTIDGSIGSEWDAKMKKQAREGFWKSLEEEVQEAKKKGEGKKGESAAAADAAKAGPSAGSGSGAADKVEKEEEKNGDDEEDVIGEEDVERIAKMMLKLQAVRDMSGTVPEEQRKKLALKAVEEVMREL
ncbi:hypothetical protein B0H65DRAFT_518365 [Neurospora tetraspora]|uniref:Alpha and gamma adaptin binding protein p34 n=1 Tax=Neurospora tetraspora TaxID=94610 RepID=A0AAE0JKT5_9PEZI|nr:hypothetical protein B0H65DRAFT_518365 [Neurospora tetraspora]